MSTLADDEKLCPFCAEVIKRAAVKCRWCGSDLAVESAPGTADFAAGTAESAEGTAESAEGAKREATEPSEPPEATEPSEPSGRRSSKRLLVPAILAVALLATAAGVGLAVKNANDSSIAPNGELSSAAVRAGIMAQAGSMAATVGSYRAAAAEDDIAAAEKLMTPAMRKKYEAQLPPKNQRAEQAKMQVTVKAAAASVSGKDACQSDDCAVSIVSATEDRARVLVFVDQVATAASTKNSVVSPIWELLTLVKKDGTWLIDDMVSA